MPKQILLLLVLPALLGFAGCGSDPEFERGRFKKGMAAHNAVITAVMSATGQSLEFSSMTMRFWEDGAILNYHDQAAVFWVVDDIIYAATPAARALIPGAPEPDLEAREHIESLLWSWPDPPAAERGVSRLDKSFAKMRMVEISTGQTRPTEV